jgi:hypothetical protein
MFTCGKFKSSIKIAAIVIDGRFQSMKVPMAAETDSVLGVRGRTGIS